MLNNVRAIFFDLFNTLVSVGRVPTKIGLTTAEILGVDSERWNQACFSEHHDICSVTNHFDILSKLAKQLDPGIDEAKIILAVEHRQRRFDYALHNVTSSVMHGLQQLRQRGIQLILVSNASSGEIEAWSNSSVSALFDDSIFSCECGFKKPERDIYHLALEKNNLLAEEVIFVGDGGSNELLGASVLGLRTILIKHFLSEHRYQQVRNEQGKSIDHEVEDFSELNDLFL